MLIFFFYVYVFSSSMAEDVGIEVKMDYKSHASAYDTNDRMSVLKLKMNYNKGFLNLVK